jgi:hypothetical protein
MNKEIIINPIDSVRAKPKWLRNGFDNFIKEMENISKLLKEQENEEI